MLTCCSAVHNVLSKFFLAEQNSLLGEHFGHLSKNIFYQACTAHTQKKLDLALNDAYFSFPEKTFFSALSLRNSIKNINVMQSSSILYNNII